MSRIILEPESRKSALDCIQSRPGNSYDGSGTNQISYCFFFGPFQSRGEKEFAAWVTICPLYLLYPGFAHWRGHSNFAMKRQNITRSSSLPVLSLLLDRHRPCRQGLLPSVEEVIASDLAATARLKLGSPQPVTSRGAWGLG